MAFSEKTAVTYLILLSALLLFFSDNSTANEKRLQIPIHIHLMNDLAVPKGDMLLKNWITKSDFSKQILSEVNKIWEPANIQFFIQDIHSEATKNHPNKAKILAFIANVKRDEKGKANPKRIKKLLKLIDTDHVSIGAINVYVVPFLGQKSQGNANRNKKRIFIGSWTDKKSTSPVKVLLVEERPMQKGSISRTLAHELGHILGLKHPIKNAPARGLLMGGKKAGYRLLDAEIAIAREQAEKLDQR